jgi:hypothetical protein
MSEEGCLRERNAFLIQTSIESKKRPVQRIKPDAKKQFRLRSDSGVRQKFVRCSLTSLTLQHPLRGERKYKNSSLFYPSAKADGNNFLD